MAERSSARGERAATICGSVAELLERLALGDALGAEGDVDIDAEPLDQPLHHRGDTGIDGAAQHEELAVAQVARDLVDRPVDRAQVGVVVLVDRRADDDDDVLGLRHRGGVEGGGEEPGLACGGEDLGRARFDEGHLTRVHRLDGFGAHVVERDVQTASGEGEPQREPDTPATPHDGDVEHGPERTQPLSAFRVGAPSLASVHPGRDRDGEDHEEGHEQDGEGYSGLPRAQPAHDAACPPSRG